MDAWYRESFCSVRLGLVLAVLLPLDAWSDDAHCRRVREQAEAEAARLMSPQLVVQGLRVPQNLYGAPLTELDTAGSAYQARAGVAFSPVDLVRGVVLTRTSDAECERYEAQNVLEAFIANAEGSARLPALRSKAAYLETNAVAWRDLLERAEARYASRVITLFEVNQLRTRAVTLERALVQARGESERLAALSYQRPSGPVSALLEGWVDRSMNLEHELARTRSLAFWNVRLSAGVVASERPVDWYGLAEVSLHVGSFFEGAHQRRALDARAEELRTDPGGIAQRLRELQRRLGSLQAQARHELELIDTQLASIAATRATLERAESPNIELALALLTFDQLLAESEKAFLTSFIDELTTLVPEAAHG